MRKFGMFALFIAIITMAIGLVPNPAHAQEDSNACSFTVNGNQPWYHENDCTTLEVEDFEANHPELLKPLPFPNGEEESNEEILGENAADDLSEGEPVWLDEPITLQVTSSEMVNVRRTPSTNSSVNFRVPNGTIIWVRAQDAAEPQWYLGTFFTQNPTTNALERLNPGFGWIYTELTGPLAEGTQVDPALYLPVCGLDETGTQTYDIAVFQDTWYFDMTSTNCNLLAEGRLEETEQHHIWVIKSPQGFGDEYLVHDGQFFPCMECSLWAYDTGWNMEDFTTKKAPIAAEFVNDKRAIMQANGYDWPIFVHKTDGQTMEWGPGGLVENVVQAGDCEFSEPVAIMVTGESFDGSMFSASIGATDCRTVLWGQLDEDENIEVMSFMGAKDADAKIDFAYLLGSYLMPESYSDTDVNEFVRTTVLGSDELSGETVDFIDIPGVSGEGMQINTDSTEPVPVG